MSFLMFGACFVLFVFNHNDRQNKLIDLYMNQKQGL